MSLLGRGLASLIPRRGADDAENILEKIDSIETVTEEPENVRRLRAQRDGVVAPKNSMLGKRLNVVEEQDESVTTVEKEEEYVMPSKPLVTPLTPDAEPDELDKEVLSEDEEITEMADDTPLIADPDEDETVDETEGVEVEEEAEPPLEQDEEEDDDKEGEDDEPDDVEEPDEQEVEENSPEEVNEDDEVEEPEEEKVEQEESEDEEAEEASEEMAEDDFDDEGDNEAQEPELELPTEKEEIASPAASWGKEEGPTDAVVLGERVEYVPIGDIEANPLQPRHMFNPEELSDLIQSIDQHGILQPLVVMPHPSGRGYQLIAGERRLRAAKELKWDRVPCIVRRDIAGDRNRLELALIENVQRSNLNPVEEALGYQRLNEEYGMTHEEIGQRVGRSRVGITNMIRLLQLPAEIQRGLIEGKISIGHARAILMIPDEEKQLRFYHHVLDEGLTVRKAENRARGVQRAMKLNDPLRKKMRGRPALALKYDGALQDRFGYNARVKFENNKNRFEVVFYAYSEGEAEDLIGKLLIDEPGAQDNINDDIIGE